MCRMQENGSAHQGTTSDKNGALKYSATYVWNSADLLGRGATASVYLGRHRVSGQVVAVKTFSDRGGSHQIALARDRELELLRTLDHKNVIRLFACEQEVCSRVPVLVMTYCQGGSLYTMLEQPQYGFGFPEEEFLTVLNHIASGLQYLWSKGVIHRDIKPGNIMRYFEEDGTSTYVLTDFGAARELPEDETFMSIYGTEEYLHPNMFQRAVLRQSGERHFTSSVDLWSLGVTLYHVACGELPFQPFGGRGNATTMFQITTEKQSGVISGIQKELNGAIEWSRDLPKTCLLSRSLKGELRSMFAGLLEVTRTKMWTFEQFFECASNLVNAIQLKVFNAQLAETMNIYMKKGECYSSLQERIAKETEIMAERQLLLVRGKELRVLIDLRQTADSYPKSLREECIILFEKEKFDIAPAGCQPIIPPFPSFISESTLSSDATLGRKCAALAYYIETLTTRVLEAQEQLRNSANYLREFISSKLHPLQVSLPQIDKVMALTKKRMDNLLVSKEHTKHIIDMVQLVETAASDKHEFQDGQWDYLGRSENNLADIIRKAETRIEEIRVYLEVLVARLAEQETQSLGPRLGCQKKDKCPTTVLHLRQSVVSVMSTFNKHKRYGDLHPHELFIHKIERQRLEDLCVQMVSLFQGHCLNNLTQLSVVIQRQTGLLLKHLTRAGKVESNMDCVMTCQDQLMARMDKVDEGFKRTATTLNGVLQRQIQALQTTGFSRVKSTPVVAETEVMSVSPGDRQPTTGASAQPVTEERKSEKRDALKLLATEMRSLRLETAELDSMMKSNADTMKRIFQDTSTLSASSFNKELVEAPS